MVLWFISSLRLIEPLKYFENPPTSCNCTKLELKRSQRSELDSKVQIYSLFSFHNILNGMKLKFAYYIRFIGKFELQSYYHTQSEIISTSKKNMCPSYAPKYQVRGRRQHPWILGSVYNSGPFGASPETLLCC